MHFICQLNNLTCKLDKYNVSLLKCDWPWTSIFLLNKKIYALF